LVTASLTANPPFRLTTKIHGIVQTSGLLKSGEQPAAGTGNWLGQ